ncbi:MAG: aspartate aminotransferase family protein, partial [Chloroflexi bacterium]
MALETSARPHVLSGEEIVALCRQYTLYEWTAQSTVDPIAVDHARGVYFYTPDGKRYIDFNSQLMSVN